MTRRRQLLKAGALGATASFTTGAYAQTQPSVLSIASGISVMHWQT